MRAPRRECVLDRPANLALAAPKAEPAQGVLPRSLRASEYSRGNPADQRCRWDSHELGKGGVRIQYLLVGVKDVHHDGRMIVDTLQRQLAQVVRQGGSMNPCFPVPREDGGGEIEVSDVQRG